LVGDIHQREARVAARVLLGHDRDHREVAMPSRHLLHAHLRAGRRRGERDLRQHLIGRERRREVPVEEIPCGDRAGATQAADRERGVERDRDGGQLGGGVLGVLTVLGESCYGFIERYWGDVLEGGWLHGRRT